MSSDFEKFGPPKTAKTTEQPKDLTDVLVQALARGLGGAFRVANLGFMSKMGEVAVLKGTEGVTGKAINESAANFTARGGTAAEAIMGGLQFDSIKDFSKLVAASIEPIQHMIADGMHGTDVSRGDLGNLYANAPGMTQSAGIGLG